MTCKASITSAAAVSLSVMVIIAAFPVRPLCAQVKQVPRQKAVELLQMELQRAVSRPPIAFEFASRYELFAGEESDLASFSEMRRGEARTDGHRVELFSEDAQQPTRDEASVVVRKEHYVWEDGRALGSREYSQDTSPGTVEYFTTAAKLHDSIRPDMSGWFLDGILIDSDHYADELLRSDELSVTEESSADGALIRIEGTTDKGITTVWMETDGSTPMVRMVSFKASESLLRDLEGLNGFELFVEIQSYDIIDDTPIATVAEALYTYLPEDAEPIVKKISCRRDEITLNPKFDDTAFHIDIPEQSIIQSYDHGTERYVYNEGHLLPYIEPDMESFVAHVDAEIETIIQNVAPQDFSRLPKIDAEVAADMRRPIPAWLVVLAASMAICVLIGTRFVRKVGKS